MCILEDDTHQLVENDRVLEEWLVPLQKGFGDEEEGEDSRINKNKQIERILIISIIKNRNNKFVINEAFLNNVASSSSEVQHTESQLPTGQRSESMTLGSTDNFLPSISVHPSKTQSAAGNSEVKLERQASSEIFVKKVLVSRETTVDWNPLNEQTKYLTSNIASLSTKLESLFIQPMDKYFKNLDGIDCTIDQIENVDLFAFLSEAIMNPNGKGIKEINLNTLKETLIHMDNCIDLAQVGFFYSRTCSSR
jgi:hypothetical protein